MPAAGSETGVQDQAAGWYRSGALGAGEQSYWNGQAWTARRRWKNNEWVDLPVEAAGSVEGGTTEVS